MPTKKTTQKGQAGAKAPADVLREDLAFHAQAKPSKKTGTSKPNKRVLIIPVEPAPIEGATVPFKLYPTAAAEEQAAERDAAEARARWLRLADSVMSGEPIDAFHERVAVANLIRERADRVQVATKAKGRGNPNFKDNAIHDPAHVAVQVEFLMRECGVSQEDAANRVAGLLGRSDITAVRKCHTKLKDQASRYVDLLQEMEREGLIRYLLRE